MPENTVVSRRAFGGLAPAVALLSALLSGCAIVTVQDDSSILASVPPAELSRATALQSQGKSADAAKAYLALAKTAQPPAKAQLEIKAAEAYLAGGQTDLAKSTLDQIPPQSLTAGQRERLLLAQAELALTADRPREALTYLDRMQAGRLPAEMETRRLGILASAQRLSNDPVAAAETLSELDEWLANPSERLLNQVSLVSTLSLLSGSELQKLSRRGGGTMRGWAEIALLTQGAGSDPKRLDTAYRQWKQRHGGHPALPDLGKTYAATLSGGYAAGSKLTVMLPRSGRFAAAAEVIRDGIEAASKADSGGERPAIRFADSANAGRARSLHTSASQGGADFVIGPLEKPAVDELAAARTLSVPTLALNEATRAVRAENLYQFSLSPENEASEAASKAAAMGGKRAAVLHPKDAWGERLAAAFRRQWVNLGGTIVGQEGFDPSWRTFDKTLSTLLDGSSADILFLVATADMARSVYPAIRQLPGEPIPVISTSHVYSGRFDEAADKGLVGLYFVDIPWMLETNDRGPLSRRAIKGGTADSPLARLYAMGIDAYRLTPRLTELAKNPGAYYPGQTGGLAIDSLGRVTRQLELGRFTEAGPRPADSAGDGNR